MAKYDKKQCFYIWLEKYGKETVGQKYGRICKKIEIGEQQLRFKILFRWMRMIGFDESLFRMDSFQTELAKFCFIETDGNKSRAKNAHDAIKRDIEIVLYSRNGLSGRKTKESKGGLGKKLKEKIETLPKSEPAAPVPAEKAPTKIIEEVDETPYAKGAGEVIIDEEFAKLIGAKTDGWK